MSTESELTKRARAVWLSPAQREAVRLMATPGAVWVGYVRTTDALERRGLCRNRRLTDLGREVLRLLAEVKS